MAAQLMDFPQDSDIIAAQDDSDADSAYAESAKTDTTSLKSWIMDYRQENGRTYHRYKDGSYYGANDPEALEHMEAGHHLYNRTFNDRLFLAPIDEHPQEVLDLGTGTGSWAIDFADRYPSAVVTGTDLSPSQPNWVPPNCKFIIDDMEADWCWADNTVDFIHIRGLHGTIRDWPRLYRQCLQALKPGGWLEQCEYSAQFTTDDNTIPAVGGITEWNRIGPECHKVLNTELQILETMKDKISDAGFTSVQEARFKWPIGPWARKKEMKDLGHICLLHVDSGLENWTLRLLTSILGWTTDEVMKLCADVRKDIYNPKIHAIHQMRQKFKTTNAEALPSSPLPQRAVEDSFWLVDCRLYNMKLPGVRAFDGYAI